MACTSAGAQLKEEFTVLLGQSVNSTDQVTGHSSTVKLKGFRMLPQISMASDT